MIMKLLLVFCLRHKIFNHNVPICQQCKYYLPYTNERFYALSRCRFFGERNIINGEIVYSFAEVSRMNEAKCGVKGKYFIPKQTPDSRPEAPLLPANVPLRPIAELSSAPVQKDSNIEALDDEET